jgi:hypothetical protein
MPATGWQKYLIRAVQTDSAIFYANQTVLIGKSTAYPLAILNAVTLLSDIYKSKNNLDSAVQYMGLAILIKDSLFNREKVRQIQDVSFNEQLHQQELQQKLTQANLVYKNRLNILFSCSRTGDPGDCCRRSLAEKRLQTEILCFASKTKTGNRNSKRGKLKKHWKN